MKIDLEKRKQKHLKVKKFSIILTIVFLILVVISATCFIIFSTYKTQLLMSIVGSAITSILAMVSIGFFIEGYLNNKYLCNFYEQLESKEEQSFKCQIKNLDKYMTLKKGLSFLAVYIGGNEYYLVDDKMIHSFDDEKVYLVCLRGNYVVGVEL